MEEKKGVNTVPGLMSTYNPKVVGETDRTECTECWDFAAYEIGGPQERLCRCTSYF